MTEKRGLGVFWENTQVKTLRLKAGSGPFWEVNFLRTHALL